ncbi:aldolase lsrF, partial [mine drainage metagenome]
YYCDGFSKVVEGCPVPLVVAGGPKLENDRAALDLARRAIDEGAHGIDMGRNIWQSDHPVAMLQALRAIVHERATVDEAMDVLAAATTSAAAPSA